MSLKRVSVWLVGLGLLWAGCSSDNEPLRQRYQLEPYEVDTTLVYAMVAGEAEPVDSVRPWLEDYYLRFRENRFPDYLDQYFLRSLAFIDSSNIEAVIDAQGDRLPFLDTFAMVGYQLEGLVDTYYDPSADEFYVCGAMLRRWAGPSPAASAGYGLAEPGCMGLDIAQSISDARVGLQEGDSILIGTLRLPYRR